MKFATLCSEDLATKVKSVSIFGSKTVSVISIDDLVAQMSSVVKPAVGILYEGARDNSGDSKQLGISAEVVFSLLLLTETSKMSTRVDVAGPTHELLDQVRNAIQGTRSPTGHFWKFKVEAAAKQTGNLSVWIQRWACPAQLPPNK